MFEKDLPYTIDGIDMTFVPFVVPFAKREDFPYSLIIEGDLTREQLAATWTVTTSRPRPTAGPEIVEVGWRFECNKHIEQLSKKTRTKALLRFAKDLRDVINEGLLGVTPSENMMLVAFPHGRKSALDLSQRSLEDGTKQRAQFAQRVGFGSVFPDNMSYGIYDNEGHLLPV